MHAVLSASNAHRWLECTPSARLEEQFPDTSSESAKEGTLAHAIAELKVRKYAVEPMGPKEYNRRFKELQADELYTKDMDTDTDAYLDYVKEILLSFQNAKPFIAVEQKVSFENYVKDGFGTADCIIISGEDLHIIDFKYGKRNLVLPYENPQLKLYGLGVLNDYALFYNIQNIHLHIFQPRMDNVGCFDISRTDLEAWGESIRGKADMAYNGDGDTVIGSHCQFCKAGAICRKRADENLKLAQYDFKKPPLLTHAEVGEILKMSEDLTSWAKELKEWALSETLKGAEVPGWKAVAGRSTRAFTDQEIVFQSLINNGVNEELLYERKPITLTAVEKLIGKALFNEILSHYVTKSEGKPTLVEESDKRQAIVKASAQDDFIGGKENE